MFSLFAGQNITTHMVFVRWGFKRQIFFNSFIYIPKNSYTELLIHYFCGKAPKPHPKTGKRSLKWLFYYSYYFSIFFKGVLFLVSINVTSNCKVNYSKLLNSNFIKTTIWHEKNPFLHPFQRAPHRLQVHWRYSSLSGSSGPPYCETSPAFIMLISWVWSALRPPTKLLLFKTVWNKTTSTYENNSTRNTTKITQKLVKINLETKDRQKNPWCTIQPPLAKYFIWKHEYTGKKCFRGGGGAP